MMLGAMVFLAGFGLAVVIATLIEDGLEARDRTE